jgi:NAD-dependent SIR2 family protein deacetylase
MMMSAASLDKRIETLAQWLLQARHLVIFTGAGISTESGLPDFRGPDGLWTRQAKGLPPSKFDWAKAMPNQAHMAIVELQNMGMLSFLISQNVDNLHLKSGIRPELLAELHGNVTKLRCRGCGFKCDHFPDLVTCPICGGKLASSVVNFGDPLPEKELEEAEYHSRHSDLFIVVGSSLVVYPAADMPRIALESGARLAIVNQEDTPLDTRCHLRFRERAGEVLPRAVALVKRWLEIGLKSKEK